MKKERNGTEQTRRNAEHVEEKGGTEEKEERMSEKGGQEFGCRGQENRGHGPRIPGPCIDFQF